MKTRFYRPCLFTNHFGRLGLKSRIVMMNHQESDAGWWRYAALWVLMVIAIMACQDWRSSGQEAVFRNNSLPPSNETRVKVLKLLEEPGWIPLLSYYQKKKASMSQYGAPLVAALRGDHLRMLDDYREQATYYINGKETGRAVLEALPIGYIQEVFILQRHEEAPGAETDSRPYRVLVQVTRQPVEDSPGRREFLAMLEAAGISNYPFGESRTFTMNKLLEATYFGNKRAFVERTKTNHLRLYDEFKTDIQVYINGIPVKPREVSTVHVREVHRLYTRERPFQEWLRPQNRRTRYVLYIQTSPKRAVRDSSYYVFSPFYSGDF